MDDQLFMQIIYCGEIIIFRNDISILPSINLDVSDFTVQKHYSLYDMPRPKDMWYNKNANKWAAQIYKYNHIKKASRELRNQAADKA
jgi:hypothetical protein